MIVAEDLPDALRESAKAYASCLGGAISEAEYVKGLQAAGLTGVLVTERLKYDASQLKALVGSDLDAFGVDSTRLDEALEEVAGRIWSAKFTGAR